MDDCRDMSDWLDRLRRRLSGDHRANHVRELFAAAYRARTKLELTEIGGPDPDRVLAATIEQVGPDYVIINQPSVGALTVQLPRGMHVALTFLLGKDRWRCRTQCQGRAKIASGGSRMLYGYRLGMPTEVHHSILRRPHDQIRVQLELAAPATIELDGENEPLRIEGVIDNLSESGMLILTDQPTAECTMGQTGIASLDLPEPLGRTDVAVTVRHLTKKDGRNAVGLEFEREMHALHNMMQMLNAARDKRAGAA